MSNLLEHAEREFKAAGWLGDKKDAMQDMMMENIRELLRVFADQGHSGFSANYALQLFDELAQFKPITPLTGADDEWNECIDPDVLQNNRCGHVFKDVKTGEVYDIEGKIFREPNGQCFTSFESHVSVTFPYTPKRVIVDVPASAEVFA